MELNTFGFHHKVAAGVTAARYTTPTPIQAKAIPLVMQGHDIVVPVSDYCPHVF